MDVWDLKTYRFCDHNKLKTSFTVGRGLNPFSYPGICLTPEENYEKPVMVVAYRITM